jgi:bifunctional non-homologous end joining protein LigD
VTARHGDPLPTSIVPMLAVLRDTVPDDEGWSFEMKWDGVRAIVTLDGGKVGIASRNLKDVTVSYPELSALGAALPRRRLVLDGEIVVFDQAGRPDFGLLQKRMHVASAPAAAALARTDPVVLLAFDLLHEDGTNLMPRPYSERRARLEALGLDAPAWQVPPAFDGGGAAAVRASRAARLEGVVAKRNGSPYRPGRRSPDWLKVKNLRTQEVVIGGWAPGKGRREGTIGSLLLGVPEEGRLRYVGQVGTGFTDEVLDELFALLRQDAADSPPFDPPPPRPDARDASWVRPRLVGEVRFTEWTGDGRLRHPAWRGLRDDKSPEDVVRES